MKPTIRNLISLLLLLCAVTALGEDGERERLAVMDIQDQTKRFQKPVLDSATNYLRVKLGATRRFIVIDKSEQEAALKRVGRAQQTESYKSCSDERCQIELGREVSAEYLLRSSITKLGRTCTFSIELVDLAKMASISAESADFDCSEDGLKTSIDAVVQSMARQAAKSGLTIELTPSNARGSVRFPDGSIQTFTGRFSRGDLVTGDYLIRAELEGYEPAERLITILPGDVLTETIQLKPIVTGVQVTGAPAGASILLQCPGRTPFQGALGEVPFRTEGLPEGTCTLTVSQAGYDSWSRELTVKRGEMTHVDVRLKKSEFSFGGVFRGVWKCTSECDCETYLVIDVAAQRATETTLWCPNKPTNMVLQQGTARVTGNRVSIVHQSADGLAGPDGKNYLPDRRELTLNGDLLSGQTGDAKNPIQNPFEARRVVPEEQKGALAGSRWIAHLYGKHVVTISIGALSDVAVDIYEGTSYARMQGTLTSLPSGGFSFQGWMTKVEGFGGYTPDDFTFQLNPDGFTAKGRVSDRRMGGSTEGPFWAVRVR